VTARIAGQDRRDHDIGLRGHPDDITRITTAANARGIPPSRWAGDALVAALEEATGWRDEARRPAPRKPNRKPRKDRQGDRYLSRLAIRVSGEEKQRITDLTTGQGLTITEWAWSVLGEALEKEGQHR
jgi:hypothetical protein